MKKWSFNYLLLSKLSEVLDISETEIARRCGLAQQVLNRYTTNETVVAVQVMMKICNSLRMPIHFFVSENNNHVLPERESATIAENNWHPIQWDTVAVERTFGDGDGRIFWKDVAKVMGVSSQKPHERFLLKTRFPVNSFLLVCSYYKLSPFKFLIDHNRNGRHTAIEPSYSDAVMRQEIADLRQRINKLDDTVDSLTCKYQSLLERYDRLELTFNEQRGSRLDMAAEKG